MITVKALQNSSSASDYYKSADYYTKDDSIDSVSYWQGLGAESLGLKGEVDKDKFKDLLDGKISDDIQLGRKSKDGIEHKPGWDLTFSVPKSVSLVALIGGDKRLITAVKSANDQAIAYIEKNYAITRLSQDGKLEYVNKKNLTVASFLQTISRELDPQLHVHNPILNMVQDESGKWRSLESHPFYEHQKLFGQIAKSFLAKNIVDLGYEIDVDAKKGTFEIKGVDLSVIKAFSKRREQIEQVAGVLGVTGARAMERLNLITRKSKKQVSKEEIIKNWDKEAKELNFDPKPLVEEAKDRAHQKQAQAKDNDVNKYLTADYTVEVCAKSKFEGEAVCERLELFDKSLKLSLGNCTQVDIDKAINDAIKDKNIFRSQVSEYNGMTGELLTTKESFRKEQYILKLMKQGQGSVRSIADETLINKVLQPLLDKKYLNKGQESTIRHISTSSDQVVAVQGYAGTGKTTMLKPATQIMQNAGYKLTLLGAYNSTAQNLQKELEMPAQTLSSFLYQTQKEIENNSNYKGRDEVLILDEASQVNASDMADLLTLVRKTGNRLVLVGDKAQMGSVEWGKPFNLMIKHGIRYSEMKEIVRQKDPVLKEAVLSIIDKDFKKSLEHLRPDAVENKDRSSLVGSLIRDYFAQSNTDRASSLIVIPDNDTRDRVMLAVRDNLIKMKEVAENGALKTTIYDRAGLNRAEKSDARFYQKGQIVEFGKAYKSLSVSDKERLMVIATSPEKGQVILGRLNSDNATFDSNKPTVIWNPDKVAGSTKYGVEVYDVKERELNLGDKIIWTNTSKKEDLKNGDRGEIIDKVKNSLLVKFDNGHVKWVDTDKLKNFDYAYAVTAHIAQGITYDKAFVVAESYRVNLVNQQSFYVSITRARYKSKLYTDDIDKLSEALIERTGEKTSSREFAEIVRRDKQKTEFEVDKIKDAFKFTIKKASDSFRRLNHSKLNAQSQDKDLSIPENLSTKNAKPVLDAKEVNILLNNDVTRVCKEVLGDPKKKVGNNLYYGRNKGSLAVAVRGEHAGKWTDFATSESGNLISLIQKQYGIDFKEALDVAAKMVNYIPGEINHQLLPKIDTAIKKVGLTEEQKLSIRKALKLVQESKDIKGTVAEKYLQEVRGIEQDRWSQDIRFHDGVYSKINGGRNPAILFIARDKDEKVQSVQAVYLKKDSGKKADVEVQKQTFGTIKGALFNTSGNDGLNKTAIICEGPEDALSICKSTTGKDIFACLGQSNFNNLNPDKLSKYEKVILALDNDGKKPNEMSNILNVAIRLSDTGKLVELVQPKVVKQDYNDLLKTEGAKAVDSIISSSKSFEKYNSNTEVKVDKNKTKTLEKEI
ncbi:MAG: conjugative relaxase [Rickettsiaceae bacterium]|nr:conjugative relaxase [Rickettsiaceae bacterium]